VLRSSRPIVGDGTDALKISVIIALSFGLSFLNEFRSEAVEAPHGRRRPLVLLCPADGKRGGSQGPLEASRMGGLALRARTPAEAQRHRRAI
jgi:hypothetical protein